LICQHSGKSDQANLNRLKALASLVIDCPTLKGRQLVDFIRAEVKRLGGEIGDQAGWQLIEAVGNDLRALAAAVGQLMADSEQSSISPAAIKRYFAGRVGITGFAIADDALAGRTSQAIIKLRWALSTGTSHSAITAALANGLRQLGRYQAAARQSHRPAELASLIGVPPWKIKDVAQQANSWTESALGKALQAVAKADAAVKGASGDADFALEQLILQLTSQRQGRSDRHR
jgi:DNA polymerase-3 subunit delta